jgi:hypothetical protein
VHLTRFAVLQTSFATKLISFNSILFSYAAILFSCTAKLISLKTAVKEAGQARERLILLEHVAAADAPPVSPCG